jgi:hypothetical protein
MTRFIRSGIILFFALLVPACHKHPGAPISYPGIWARTYGTALNEEASVWGDVAFLGTSYAVAGWFQTSKAWVVRLGLDGSILWQKSYGPSGTIFSSIAAVPAGGLIAVGSTTAAGAGSNDVWVVRLADDGSILWQKTYGGSGNDYGWRVRATADGGFVVLCSSNTFSGTVGNPWILKLNSDGSVAWQKTIIHSNSLSISDITEIPGGGYIIAAGESFGASFGEAWIIRLQANGTIAWQNRYGTTADEGALTAVPTIDGGFLVVASVNTASSGPSLLDPWLLRLDGTGAILWQKTYAATASGTLNSCEAEPDGSFLLSGVTGGSTGSTGTTMWAVHLLSDGSIDWQRQFGLVTGMQYASSLRSSPYGGLVLSGTTTSYGAGTTDFWVLHLNDDGTCPPLDSTTSVTIASTSVSPVATTNTEADTSIVPADTAVVPVDTFAVSVPQVP